MIKTATCSKTTIGWGLTIGKTYNIKREFNGGYLIANDFGREGLFPATYFA